MGTEITRCTRCILPTSLPSVQLDDQGVCNYCRTFDRRFANWDAAREKRRETFEKIVQRVKGLGRDYDCCIPLSGGKDSVYSLYICDHVYGLKCLAITFDNGFLSNQARRNIDQALLHSSADHIFYSINRRTMLALYRQFILSSGNLCPACMRGIDMVKELPPRALNIPLVITGTGIRNSYLSSIPELFQAGQVDYFKKVLDEAGTNTRCGPLCSTAGEWNLQRIRMIGSRLLRMPNLTDHYSLHLYDYFDNSPSEIYTTIHQEMGWEMSDGLFEHSDCLLHRVPFYLHTLKFPDLSEKTFYLCHQIRLGHLSRNEAMEQESQLMRDRTPPPILASFLKEIGLSEEEFQEAVRDWRKIERYRSQSDSLLSYLSEKYF